MSVLLLAATGAFAADNTNQAKRDGTMDWPQYRGPLRDGTVLASQNGGSCSPVVSSGKVILYVNPRPLTPKKLLITPDYLARWGWNAELRADLAKKLEAERRKHVCARRIGEYPSADQHGGVNGRAVDDAVADRSLDD